MASKDVTYTTETAPDGSQIVSEISSVTTETAPHGTETVTEITTTAGEDDPTQIEGHIIVTETAPDGTETVVEITTNADGTVTIEEGDDSTIEEIIEAVFDDEIVDDEAETAFSAAETQDNAGLYAVQNNSDIGNGSMDYAAGSEMFAANALPVDVAETGVVAAPFDYTSGVADTTYSAATTSSTFSDSSLETTDSEAAEQEAHVQAATEAQQAADDFTASGDYEAAAQAREVAENEASEAGTEVMLSAYDSSDLRVAAEKQDEAEYYSEQQALHAQQGDYEAAREDAANAAYATYEADSTAGGADHTGQADAEHYNMDWAVHEGKQADYYAESAADALADGDFENAEMYAASAIEHQESADHFGDLGEHGGEIAVYDPSSDVATGGTYQSSFDSSAMQVDTGFDASVDMSASSGFDSTTDDV